MDNSSPAMDGCQVSDKKRGEMVRMDCLGTHCHSDDGSCELEGSPEGSVVEVQANHAHTS